MLRRGILVDVLGCHAGLCEINLPSEFLHLPLGEVRLLDHRHLPARGRKSLGCSSVLLDLEVLLLLQVLLRLRQLLLHLRLLLLQLWLQSGGGGMYAWAVAPPCIAV